MLPCLILSSVCPPLFFNSSTDDFIKSVHLQDKVVCPFTNYGTDYCSMSVNPRALRFTPNTLTFSVQQQTGPQVHRSVLHSPMQR